MAGKKNAAKKKPQQKTKAPSKQSKNQIKQYKKVKKHLKDCIISVVEVDLNEYLKQKNIKSCKQAMLHTFQKQIRQNQS